MTSKLVFIFAVLFMASLSQAAYFRADLPTPNGSSKVGTHIIFSGKGLEVGDQWIRAAHTQALVFRDRPGTGMIRYIGAIENDKTLPMLKAWGYTNIEVFDKTMTGNAVVAQMALVDKIASIDFIGHNGALYGLALEDYNNRFFLDQIPGLQKLKSRMGKDAVVRLLGCNTGWNLAPAVANALQVPVSGTFTFADIQALFSSNEWFYNDEGRFPSELTYLTTNAITYADPVKCKSQGGCLRLKTVNSNYQGKHGNYGGTLPFAKYFCGGLSDAECFRRMAKSLVNQVSTVPVNNAPSKEQFAKILSDLFCPDWKDAQRRADCHTRITNHVLGTKALSSTFTTSDGQQMVCTFKKCEFKKVCGDSCVLESTGGTSTAYVDELNAYIRGYNVWMDDAR